MGSSLKSVEFAKLNLNVASAVNARVGTVSFDPNLRKEMQSAPGMSDAKKQIATSAGFFLPNGRELTLLNQAHDEQAAIAELLESGIQAIAK